jgi:CheY-like chemotaxis protein
LLILDLNIPGLDGFTLVEQLKRRNLSGEMGQASPKIILLTAVGQPGDGIRCRELGIDSYLTKPIQPRELLQVIQASLGKDQSKSSRARPISRHSIREERPGLLILVVEDNLVNQKLVLRLLEKRGHRVVLACNGLEAIDQFQKHLFDLVLMDVQMPEMDGFEATARIREIQKQRNNPVPIVAMTAHALKGDRERCLEVGMDGYVSKPIVKAQLFSEIDRFVQPNRAWEDVVSISPP